MSLELLKIVLNEFENELKSYSYKVYTINEKEKIFIIEDSLVLYAGFLTEHEDWYGECNCLYKRELDLEYRLKIEELTFNSINFNCQNYIIKYGYFYLKFFRCNARTIDYKNPSFPRMVERPSLVEKINLLIPEIQLKERINGWQGLLYYFIVVEIVSYNNTIGIGVSYTTSKPYSYILNKGRLYIKDGQTGLFGYSTEKALKSWHGKGLKRKDVIENNLTYFFIEKYIKDKNKLRLIEWEILDNAEKDLYKNIERSTFKQPVNKWKTEELVFNCVKKIYKNYNVIYQHRPFFLKSKIGGQMSYDIFISGLNIAIEYQGKQHFEPIDFFGGKENYLKTIENDKLKAELSEQNGIKLIYINYWDNITEDFIKNKINKVLKK